MPAANPLHERLKALREREQHERDERDMQEADARERATYVRHTGVAAAVAAMEAMGAVDAAPIPHRVEVAAVARRKQEWGRPATPDQHRRHDYPHGVPLLPQPPSSAPVATAGGTARGRERGYRGRNEPLPDLPLHNNLHRLKHHVEQQQREQQRVAGVVEAAPDKAIDWDFKVHYGPKPEPPRYQRRNLSPTPQQAAAVPPAAARRPRSPSPAGAVPAAAAAARRPRSPSPLFMTPTPAAEPSPRRQRASSGDSSGSGSGVMSERQSDALARYKAARSRSPSPDRGRTRAAAPASPRSLSPSMERLDKVLHGAQGGPSVAGGGGVPGMDRVRRPARHGAVAAGGSGVYVAVKAAVEVHLRAAGARPLTPQKRDGGVRAGECAKKVRGEWDGKTRAKGRGGL